nr:uncharacterized mitochondrial protein AtMg00810-like [Tanacetum cinerariifolium]
MGLWYPKDTGFELTIFSDSDHAGCLDSRKSTSGGIQFLGGDKLVSWSSKKQDCTSMSSAEADEDGNLARANVKQSLGKKSVLHPRSSKVEFIYSNFQEGDIRFLYELLIDDFILSHELSDANFEDNPSISRPPPEPPDDNFDLEPEVISAVTKDNDEPDEYFNPGGENFVSTNNEDVDYFPFMFVIRIFLPYLILPEISPLLLSAESEDTIFDPGLSPEIEVILCRIYVRFPRSSYPLIDFSLGRQEVGVASSF